MERKTMTTLSELRIGDRFVYPKRADVWIVMARGDKKGRVAVNQYDQKKEPLWRHDELKRGSTKIMFLRHGIPLPGEECFIEDLQPGDIFFRPDDLINEYVIQEKGHAFYKVRKTTESSYVMAGKLSTVTLVKRKEV